MKRYIVKKLLWLMPQLLIISFVCFVIINLMPTDAAEASLRVNKVPIITPEMLAQRRIELGLDQPFLTRYMQWLTNALVGNFGMSYVLNKPVSQVIFASIGPTLYLASVSLIIIISISLLIGILTAIYKGTWFDKLMRWCLFLVTAAPSFWIALLFIWFFAVQLKWFQTGGMTNPTSIILPAMTLALGYLSTYIRLIRGNMIEQETEMYITYAKACGLSQKTIIGYMIKNSLQTSIAALSMSIPKLLAGTVVIENIFAWPGLGRVVIAAIFNKDYPIIQAYIVIMAVLFITCGTAMDMVMYSVDPRLRGEK